MPAAVGALGAAGAPGNRPALYSLCLPPLSIFPPVIAPLAIVYIRSPLHFLSPPTGWAALRSLLDVAGQ